MKALFNTPAVTALCWTLYHSLWQGLVFAFIAGMILVGTKRLTAAFRYKLLSILFWGLIGIIGFTFCYEWQNSATLYSHQSIPNDPPGQSMVYGASAAAAHSPGQSLFSQILANFLTDNAWLIVAIWFFILGARLIRITFTLSYTNRLKTNKSHLPDIYWRNKIASLCEQMQITKAVSLLESEIIKIPVVFGHLKPVIFIPFGLVTNLATYQVEAILLHELAHIRRNDYLFNFFQHLAETFLFFNPGLLWISSLLRDERENCCDDIAIGMTKDKRQFVETLISFKQLTTHNNSNYHTAFPGRKNHVLNRVVRIIEDKNKTLRPRETILLLLGVVLLSAFTFMTRTGTEARDKSPFSQPHVAKVSASLKPPPLHPVLVPMLTARVLRNKRHPVFNILKDSIKAAPPVIVLKDTGAFAPSIDPSDSIAKRYRQLARRFQSPQEKAEFVRLRRLNRAMQFIAEHQDADERVRQKAFRRLFKALIY